MWPLAKDDMDDDCTHVKIYDEAKLFADPPTVTWTCLKCKLRRIELKRINSIIYRADQIGKE